MLDFVSFLYVFAFSIGICAYLMVSNKELIFSISEQSPILMNTVLIESYNKNVIVLQVIL